MKKTFKGTKPQSDGKIVMVVHDKNGNRIDESHLKSIEPVKFYRPSTRGELLTALKNGVICEIVADVAEITTIMLNGWLKFDDFTTEPSHNAGWMIYKPTKNPG
jgi:hypothetical protein